MDLQDWVLIEASFIQWGETCLQSIFAKKGDSRVRLPAF